MTHFEILIEDQSGSRAMEILLPKLLEANITFRVHAYKGIGHIPKGLKPNSDASKRQLLNQLPRILRGYGKVPDCGTILVICDLDDRDKEQFLSELNNILDNCRPQPKTFFFLAIEEFEAWYLGDLNAIRKAYPNAKNNIINSYSNDSICGTWELLADAICSGGHKALVKKGWWAVGEQKIAWAKSISPNMDVEINKSPSFNAMVAGLREITE